MSKSPSTWTHPSLGVFTKDSDDNYSATLPFPAFKAFSYDTGYDNAPRSNGKHTLTFSAGGLSNPPTPEASALAATVVANQQSLAEKIAAALWEEFNGRGPSCGYWWYGNLDQIIEACEENDLPPPKGPKDLYRLLQLANIEIAKRAYPDDADYASAPTLAELQFHAAFEEEHGLGVLTDGTHILGISYMTDNATYQDAQNDNSDDED